MLSACKTSPQDKFLHGPPDYVPDGVIKTTNLEMDTETRNN